MKARKLNKVLMFALTLTLVIGVSSCGKDDSLEDKCDATRVDTKVGNFDVKAKVEYANLTPYQGTVRLGIYKTYCDETENGKFTISGTSDENGYYDPHYTYQYNYSNLQDRVTLKWFVTDPADMMELEVLTRTYYYDHAEEESWIINDVFDIRLGWSEPE
jgi:hypothetical protein